MTDTFVKLPEPVVKERSSTTVTAYFRSAANAAEAPTTIHYRLDDLSTNTEVLDWTSVSAAASASISITPAQNKIHNNAHLRELRQITVAADKGLAGETRDTAVWKVVNIGGFDE